MPKQGVGDKEVIYKAGRAPAAMHSAGVNIGQDTRRVFLAVAA